MVRATGHPEVFQYLDLWGNQEQEDKGEIDQETFNRLATLSLEGKILVALGGSTQRALDFCKEPFQIRYAFHPATRDPFKLKLLQATLDVLAKVAAASV